MSEPEAPAIVAFKPRQNPEHPPLVLGAKYARYGDGCCQHDNHSAQVSRDERRVYCGGCGVELDPIDVLWHLAQHGLNLDSRVATIAEHERKEHEKGERKAQEDREAVPGIVARLRRGDEVSVEYRNDNFPRGCGTSGLVVAVSATTLTIGYGDPRCDDSTIAIDEIWKLRIRRKAKNRRS